MHPIRLTTLAGLFLLAAPAFADEAPRTVTVDGRGEVSATPDLARISLAIEARHEDMDRARDEALAVTRSFLGVTKRLDVDDKHVRSSGLTIRPEYRWNDVARRQELTGYLVQRNFDVMLDDLDKLGDLMEGAVDAGVNQVSPPELLSSREKELRREALAAAARDAETNARLIAETLGARLGPARQVTTLGMVVPQPIYKERMMAAAAIAMDQAADTYGTGEIRIEASVSATFDLVSD